MGTIQAHPTDRPAETTSDGDDLGHMVAHCDHNRTLCGLDATRMPWAPYDNFDDDPNPCIVCDDIDLAPICPLCGHIWGDA